MTSRKRRMTIAACAVWLTAGTLPLSGQSLVDRTPNMSGGWTGDAGAAYFHFLHRFNHQGPPERRVMNRPTFLLGAAVAPRVLLGVQYATRSEVVARVPNEWEALARYAIADGDGTLPFDVTVQAGYNAAARSVDGEIGVARSFGRVRVLGAARALSSAYGEGAGFVAAAGALLSVTPGLSLAGDVAQHFDGGVSRAAWGVGLHGVIPQSPHSFSLHATNTSSATLQGASRGAAEIRWGFEFTVPVTIARYFGGSARAGDRDDAASAGDTRVASDSVVAAIRGMAFVPERIEIEAGTAVVWQNDDEVMHTATADDESFDSGPIQPGGRWRRVFDVPGEYPYYCGPHPFMQGVVVVRQP